jgi:hypothetical protein
MELTIPMPPTNTNSAKGRSRHWRVLEKEKNAYWEMLDLYVVLGRIPDAPHEPIAQATIRSVMYLGGAMDDDNAMARHKWPIDWLRKRGYIAGDRRTNLRWEGLPHQIVKRDKHYRMVLTLTPVDAVQESLIPEER